MLKIDTLTGHERMSTQALLLAIEDAVRKAPNYAPGAPEIVRVAGFDDAIRAAADAAQEGDVVLLSPASTSFDRFKNFEERGNRFRRVVEELE